MPKIRTRASLAAILVTSALFLAGCSTPPWEVAASSENTTAETSSAAAPSSTVKPSVQVISNDLSAGSTKRTLTAGAATLTVQYWSTLNMGEWTAGATKPLTIKVSAKLKNSAGQQIYLAKVSSLISVSGPNGVIGDPLTVNDAATISPGYLIKSPYSYDQTLLIPSVDSTANQLTITISFDVLIQAKPKSTHYAKQTASDTLKIAIAG